MPPPYQAKFTVRVPMKGNTLGAITIAVKKQISLASDTVDQQGCVYTHYGPILLVYALIMLAGQRRAGDTGCMNTVKMCLRTLQEWLAILLPLLLLAGCARTHVASEVTASDPSLLPPHQIALVIDDQSVSPRKADRARRHDTAVATTRVALMNDLQKMLSARHLAVVASGQPADMTLTCTLTKIRPGSTVARLLIGYGAGKAELQVRTVLAEVGSRHTPLLSFVTTSTTGAMPGAGIGVASAASAAGTAVHMAGPLLGVPGTLRQGWAQEAQQTTDRIDERLAAYFQARNWPYPRLPTSWLSRL